MGAPALTSRGFTESDFDQVTTVSALLPIVQTLSDKI